MKDLLLKLDALINSLKLSNNESVEYFLTIKDKLNSSDKDQLRRTLESLCNSYSLSQYGGFSNIEAKMLLDLINIADKEL